MKRLFVAALLALSFGASSALSAAVGTATASNTSIFAEAIKAKKVTDPPPLAVVGVQEDGLSGRCSLRAALAGSGRKGVRGTFDAVLIDGNTGNMISDLGRRTGKTKKDGLLTVDYPVPRMADFAVQAAMLVDLNVAGGKKVTELEFSCELIDVTP